MINREERQARETASAEWKRRARTRRPQDRTVNHHELSQEDLYNLIQSKFNWQVLPRNSKSYKTQRICRVFQTINRDPTIEWGIAYESAFDCMSDLFTYRTGRRLVIDFGLQVVGLLRGGYFPVRRLDDWRPPEQFQLREVLLSLSIEWFGAYKGRMRTYAIKPCPGRYYSWSEGGQQIGMYHLRNHLQQGRSIGAWPVAKAYHDAEKGGECIQSLPDQMKFPKLIALHVFLRSLGLV